MKRPGRFEAGAVSPARRILMAGGGLLFVDSFLPWQRTCVLLTIDFPLACTRSIAWSGSGFFAGSLMALLGLALFATTAAPAIGMDQLEERRPRLIAALAIGTMAFGLIKFLYAVAHHPALAAWVGLVLMAVVGYGLFRKEQEDNRIPGR
jgi:hypothetical protein